MGLDCFLTNSKLEVNGKIFWWLVSRENCGAVPLGSGDESSVISTELLR